MKTFMYFGYGSNLLARRIHIQNPHAVRKTVGQLKNYRLDFYNVSDRWNGAPATIVPDEEHNVWGAIWEMDSDHVDELDRQEGVVNGIYKPLIVPIEVSNNETILCRLYQLVNYPTTKRQNNIDEYNRNPSKTYIDVIIEGAIESGLPENYLKFLQSIVHNGQLADQSLIEALKIKT